MAVDLIIAYEAEQDIAQAYAWYESQRVGLGEDFLGRLDSCIRTVLRNPETRTRSFMRTTAGRWFAGSPTPYSTSMTNEAVTIYCVFHTWRDPNKWRDRLPCERDPAPSHRLRQSDDSSLFIDVDPLGRGPIGKARHADDVARQGDEEAGAGGDLDVADGQGEPRGRPRSLGLSESESCVLAMQIGSSP